MAATLVTPVKCPRCGGSGNLRCRTVHLGVPGLCWTCDGYGKVEGDPATLAAAAERRAEGVARRDALRAWEAAQTDRRVVEASWALLTLEPARYEKFVDSVAAGREVVPALLTYLAQAEADLAAAGGEVDKVKAARAA